MEQALEAQPKQGTSQRWFGSYSLAENQTAYFRIGPLQTWVQRFPGEYRIARQIATDPNQNTWEVAHDVAESAPSERAIVDRYGFSDAADGAALSVMPALADRPVVARPEKPFHLPPRQNVDVFVGSPLWLQIKVGDVGLFDQPIFRPSNTWFGPTTMEGELCYASRTYLRLDRRLVHYMPHRAMTLVHILNRSNLPLDIESLRLPVARLSLYESQGELWTQDVRFERHKDGDFAALQLKQKPPSAVQNASLLAEPRDPSKTNAMVRAFSAIFS